MATVPSLASEEGSLVDKANTKSAIGSISVLLQTTMANHPT